MVSPQHKRRAVEGVVKAGLCSQRRACRYLGLQRSSSRYEQKAPTGWVLRLHQEVEVLSRTYPRLGYRKLTRLLRQEGWQVGRKLVQRIRRDCGLKVKRWMRRPRRRGRSTGTIPTRAERLNHVWSWDFVHDQLATGPKLRILTVIDEYSRECLALHAARKLTAHDLVEVMERLVAERGAPAHMRSDNGSEFIARILQGWLAEHKVKTLYIEPGSPWQNGHVESFNGSLRDECLDRELMLSVAEARVLIEDYRRHYNEERPHGGIGYRTPAQTRIEAQALGSSRPTGSLHQELDPTPQSCYTTNLTQTSHSFWTKYGDSITCFKSLSDRGTQAL